MIIEGGATNKSFVLDLLDQPEVIDASADTGWIDRVRGEGRLVSHRHSAVALAAAAIEAYEEEERVERQRLLSTAFGGRPQVQHESGRPLELKLRGAGYRVRVARVGAHRFRVGVEAGDRRPHRRRRARPLRPAHRADRRQRHPATACSPARTAPIHLVEVDGVTHRVSRDEGGVAALPDARAGGRHPAGGRRRGRGRRAGAGAGEHEDGDGAAGAVPGPAQGMRRLGRQPGGDRCAAAAAGAARRRRRRPRTPRPPTPSSWTCPPRPRRPGRGARSPAARRTCAACCWASTSTRTTSAGCSTTTSTRAARATAGRPPAAGRGARAGRRVRRPGRAEPQPAGRRGRRRRQPRAQRPRVLPHLPAEPRRGAGRAAGGVPGQARQGARALRRHRAGALARARSRGVPDLPRPAARGRRRRASSPRCCGRGCGSRRRTRRCASPPVSRWSGWWPRRRSVSRWWPTWPAAWCSPGSAQPLLRRNRARVYAGVRKHLRHLDAHPDAPDRAERIAEMVRSTEPLVRLLGQRLVRADLDNAVMLEVLTRRYYGNKGTHRRAHHRGRPAARSWSPSGPARRSCPPRCSFEALGDALRGLAELAGRRGRRRRRHLPRLGEPAATTPTRWPPRCTRSSARTRCRTRCAGSPSRSRAAAAR